ncbi:MAG: nuclease, partial [Pseudarthrobacter sp.]|nr:nuclease [Pseudarthrobacter sp.]
MGSGSAKSPDADPLREWSADCLDGLALVRTADAQLAGLKVGLVTGFSDAEWAMASPDQGPQQRKVQDMSIVTEVACVLTVSERSASALLAESHELTRALPLTLAALQGGAFSW